MNGEREATTRVTVYYEQPNPLFEKWLTDLYNASINEGSSKQYMYKKALQALKKFPLPLHSGKECLVLEYFGPDLCQFFEWKLQEHKQKASLNREQGVYVPNPMVVESSRGPQDQNSEGKGFQKQGSQSTSSEKKIQSRGTSQTSNENIAKSKRKSGEYVPEFRSGPYAFLITLLSHEGLPNFLGYLTKAELLKEAQQLCDASLTKPVPGSRYTAWSSMSSLVNKGLISRTGNPARFSLTLEGRDMARRLLQANPSKEVGLISSSLRNGDNDHCDQWLNDVSLPFNEEGDNYFSIPPLPPP